MKNFEGVNYKHILKTWEDHDGDWEEWLKFSSFAEKVHFYNYVMERWNSRSSMIVFEENKGFWSTFEIYQNPCNRMKEDEALAYLKKITDGLDYSPRTDLYAYETERKRYYLHYQGEEFDEIKTWDDLEDIMIENHFFDIARDLVANYIYEVAKKAFLGEK